MKIKIHKSNIVSKSFILLILMILICQTGFASVDERITNEDLLYDNVKDAVDAGLSVRPPNYKTYSGITDKIGLLSSRSVYTINKLGLNQNQGTTYVRETTDQTSAIVGSIGYREIVYVYNITNGCYFIKYKTPTTYKYGYILTANVSIPGSTYSLSKPIGSGYISQDYLVNGHTGIDIAGIYHADVNAIDTGGSYFNQVRWKNPDNNVTYLISYGNYVKQNVSAGGKSLLAYYAHLSSFSGVNTPSYPSLQKSASEVSGEQTYTLKYETRYSGDKIGETGNVGNSYGEHLHFEMRENNTIVDPFDYVLFPDIGYIY
jgi:murein DD-endopeptidase MepM/ murein hydrolase activator NlpD